MSETLYHGTGIYQLAQIIESGIMEASVPDDHDTSGIVGVSLTMDLDVARKFADEAKERDWHNEWDSPVDDGVVLVFERDVLASIVTLSPVLWDGVRIEAEVRSHGHILSPMRAIRRIEIEEAALAWWKDKLMNCEPELAAALESVNEALYDFKQRTAVLNPDHRP